MPTTSVSHSAPSRPRAAVGALVVAAASLTLLLSGCTDSTPAQPSTSTSTDGGDGSGGSEHGSSGHSSTDPAHPTHTTHPTTVPPTSGHYDPNKCPPGLLCSPSEGGGSGGS